jgi:hypothetical protein
MDRILIRSTPKITPTRISVLDIDSPIGVSKTLAFSPDSSQSGYAARKGEVTPIVIIGGARIPEESIRSMTVWQEDLLPHISITITDTESVFGAGAYPIANILASVFVKSKNQALKSLSADYLITSIASVNIPNSNATVYTLVGELHVPKLHGNFSKSFKQMTSLEALKRVADDLQLGFADNQPDNTNDRMTWLMPNYSYKSLIHHIKKMAYRDDSNFFDCFIDRYYILNFINVEKMFSQDPELDKGFLALTQTVIDKRRFGSDNGVNESTDEIDIVLSNHVSTKGSEFYISDFSLFGHHGEVLANHGLRKHAYWYDHGQNRDPAKLDSVNFIDHFTEPIITPIANDGLRPQTTTVTDFSSAQSSTGIWSGIDYGNAHAAYKFSNLVNHHNLLETKKNQLKISLPGFNINVLRGSRVAVALFLEKYSASNAAAARAKIEDLDKVPDSIDKENPENIDSALGQVLDKALSGFYYVSAIKYIYNQGKFHTEMTLSRRHWLLQSPTNQQ